MDMSTLLRDWISNPAPIMFTSVGVAVAAYLYARGIRYGAQKGIGRPVAALQVMAFASGLLVTLVALASPLDALADQSFAAHMLQHELLVLVAAPLLLLGQPLWRMWRAVPLTARRTSLRWLLRQRRIRQSWDAIESFISRPAVALALFVGVYLLWHVPVLYQLALHIEVIHAFEHLCFLAVALIFWAHVIPLAPLPCRLSYLRRAGYLFVASLALHLFAVLIAIANRPIYTYYGVGASAVADQTAGGALMDVGGMVVFTVAILICLGFWLHDDERARGGEPQPVSAASETTPSGALLMLEMGVAEAQAKFPSSDG